MPLMPLPDDPRPRTEAQVNALWPADFDTYEIRADVLIPVLATPDDTVAAATGVLAEHVAGSHKIRPVRRTADDPIPGTFHVIARLGRVIGGTLFDVEFRLPVAEARQGDVEEYLLRGYRLGDVLVQQFAADMRRRGLFVDVSCEAVFIGGRL